MEFLRRFFEKRPASRRQKIAPIFLINTLSGKKELFVPQKPEVVSLYSCGPTVYGKQHIGNMRAAVFADTLARVLLGAGYHVHRVTNITDVGHLVGDGDVGEDKMNVGAVREKKSPAEIADTYTKMYIDDLSDLNIDTESILFPRATQYIQEQIALAKTLEEKGFAYILSDGLYFDTQKFIGYGKLGGHAKDILREGARIGITSGKRGAQDFVLWRKAKPNDLQYWNSPWGTGNPGWHIECSAMSRALLGQEIDIHTGGEEHVSIHHNNEIAQSEGASGRTFVHYWLHNAHLTLEGGKLAKSAGHTVYLSDVTEKGFHPLSLRYFFLQAHYRSPLSFSWEALAGAASGLNRLWNLSRTIKEESAKKSKFSNIQEEFLAAMRDDLATARALSIMWEALRSDDYTPEEKWGLLEVAEVHMGLSLSSPPGETEVPEDTLPESLHELVARREAARSKKDFTEADRMRGEIENSGYHVDDGPNGPVLTKRTL